MFFEFEKCMRRARALQLKWFGLGVRLAHTLADNYVAEESESTFFQFSFGMFEFIGCVYFRSHVRKKNTHRHRAERDREKGRERESQQTYISMKAINLFAALYLLSNRNSPYTSTRLNNKNINRSKKIHHFFLEFECFEIKKKCSELKSIKWCVFLFLFILVPMEATRWNPFLRINCKYWSPGFVYRQE